MVLVGTIALSIVLRHLAIPASQFQAFRTGDVSTYGENVHVLKEQCVATPFLKQFCFDFKIFNQSHE